MTKKFTNVNYLDNWNNIKQNKKSKKKDHEVLFKKTLDKDKISIIEKKNNIEESMKILPSTEKNTNMDLYGLKEMKKKNSKHRKGSKSQKKNSVKTNLKFPIQSHKQETLKKREDG